MYSTLLLIVMRLSSANQHITTIVFFCVYKHNYCPLTSSTPSLDHTLQNGPLPPLRWLGLAWALRELWTFPLFLGGVWSREVAWKGARFRLKLGGKAIKLE